MPELATATRADRHRRPGRSGARRAGVDGPASPPTAAAKVNEIREAEGIEANMAPAPARGRRRLRRVLLRPLLRRAAPRSIAQFEIDGRQGRRRPDEPDVPRRHRDRLRRGPAGRRLQVQQPEREVDLRLRLVVLASERSAAASGAGTATGLEPRCSRASWSRARHRPGRRAARRLRPRREPAPGVLPARLRRARARSTEQVAAVLRICRERKVPVTPRGAGSGMCGGALPVARRRRAVDRADAADQRDRSRATWSRWSSPAWSPASCRRRSRTQGLFYPPDPASLEFCSIGGNAATNAGGPRAFKYGVTREYVLGLEVALMGGEVLRCGRRTAKGVTGYDLVAGFVGTEGTFGVITELASSSCPGRRPRPPCSAVFADVAAAGAAITALLRGGLRPRVLELADQRLDRSHPRRRAATGSRPTPARSSLIEVDGEPEAMPMQMERIGAALRRARRARRAGRHRAGRAARAVGGAPADLAVAQGGATGSRSTRTSACRAARSSRCSRAIDRGRRAETGIADRGVRPRRRRQPARQPAVERRSRRPGGARADVGRGRAGVRATRSSSAARCRGEHGIGLAKRDYMPLEQSEQLHRVAAAVEGDVGSRRTCSTRARASRAPPRLLRVASRSGTLSTWTTCGRQPPRSRDVTSCLS